MDAISSVLSGVLKDERRGGVLAACGGLALGLSCLSAYVTLKLARRPLERRHREQEQFQDELRREAARVREAEGRLFRAVRQCDDNRSALARLTRGTDRLCDVCRNHQRERHELRAALADERRRQLDALRTELAEQEQERQQRMAALKARQLQELQEAADEVLARQHDAGPGEAAVDGRGEGIAWEQVDLFMRQVDEAHQAFLEAEEQLAVRQREAAGDLASFLEDNTAAREIAEFEREIVNVAGVMHFCGVCREFRPDCDCVQCVAGHATCGECISGAVQVNAEEGGPAIVRCPQCVAQHGGNEGAVCQLPAEAFVSRLTSSAAAALLRTIRSDAERAANIELQRLAALLEQQERRDDWRRIANRIREEVLTLRCPRCRAAFIDFEGCFAVTCRACRCAFCAWCVTDCGADAHQHVRQCPENQEGGQLFSTVDKFELHHRVRRQRQVRQQLEELEGPVREQVRLMLQQDLRDLGIEP